MKKRYALVALAVLLAAPILGIASVGATPTDKAQAEVLGPVVRTGEGTATVRARYICPDGFHLWVSAKQVESGRPDKRLQQEGSSSISSAWLQSHPDPSTFTCDGQWHEGTYQIDTLEQGWGDFRQGQVWVQFCLVGDPTFISSSRWVAVV